MDLVLASTSPWRIQMLASAGVRCTGVAPPVDEAAIVRDDPVEMARARATAKATSVAALFPRAAVIGADQVCWLDGAPGAPARVFHKPVDAAEHLRQLLDLQGRAHTLSTAVCVVIAGEAHVLVDHSVVQLRPAGAHELQGYVASGEGRACAGGYQVEGLGAWLVDRIEGDWFNVVGLPLFRVLALLRLSGVVPPYISPGIALARATEIA